MFYFVFIATVRYWQQTKRISKIVTFNFTTINQSIVELALSLINCILQILKKITLLP